MRNTRLDNVPIEQALQRWMKRIRFRPATETLPTPRTRGRVTASPVYARLSMPAYPAAAMDGIAVRAEETAGAGKERPLRLRKGRDFQLINTGDPLPEGKNAVIMIERVREVDERTVEITEPALPWQHVRQAGEDVMAGEMILPAHHVIRPVDMGALLAGGVTEVPVLTRPRVAVIPTGSEMISPGSIPDKGQIIEFNGTVFSGYLEEWGAVPDYRGIVRDDPAALRQAVEAAVDTCDMVVINAGSSAGTRDYTPQVVMELGEVLIHGVAARPGRPVVLGVIRGKPVLGLPGYPVSAYLSLEWFVRPLIHRWNRQSEPERSRIRARLTRPVAVKSGGEDFIRMRIGKVDGEWVASPLSRGAGVTISLVKADGLLRVPAESCGFEAGEIVTLELYKPVKDVGDTLLWSGCDEPLMDRLSSLLRQRKGWGLSGERTGSCGGIDSLKQGECHLAVMEGPNAEKGDPFPLQKELKNLSLAVVKLCRRRIGWILGPQVRYFTGLGDLTDGKWEFINRPRGSAMRRLLETELAREGIPPDRIRGFRREEVSCFRAAAAVATGTADVTLGTEMSAERFGLSFVPWREDQVNLVIPLHLFRNERIREMLEVIRSPAFRNELESLKGYMGNRAGEILHVQGRDGAESILSSE